MKRYVKSNDNTNSDVIYKQIRECRDEVYSEFLNISSKIIIRELGITMNEAIDRINISVTPTMLASKFIFTIDVELVDNKTMTNILNAVNSIAKYYDSNFEFKLVDYHRSDSNYGTISGTISGTVDIESYRRKSFDI